ncbi:MAG: hypothetical protein JO038_09420 [Alphaproteobacteria bacterium]|nr:hypothetical protein [Alphaproteobacteria bacterium]
MPRLAIVSTYNQSCGNASYTYALKKAFSEHLETDVIPLDLFLLRTKGSLFNKHGDDHIREIARRLRDYDYVNIQFEAGLFGSSLKSIQRRTEWLIDAAKNLIFTMHRIDPLSSTKAEVVKKAVSSLNHRQMVSTLRKRAYELLYYNLINKCREASRTKNVWIAVHTTRERRIVKDLYKFDNCFDFPLTFLFPEEREELRRTATRSQFLKRHSIPEDRKVVGAFGYIAQYKGFDTLIRCLWHLPDDYVLCIFGSQHPMSIKPQSHIEPYLGSLLEQMKREAKEYIDSRVERIKDLASTTVTPDEVSDLANFDPADRIRFMGNMPDPEFIEALHCCDAVVLPYLEVGQSMSGVVSLAMESDARLFCSNNLSFFEVRKYYGNSYHTFDMGNYIEIAQKVQFATGDFAEERDSAFAKYNIRNGVIEHLLRFQANGDRLIGGDSETVPRRSVPAERAELEAVSAD